jgi:dTDP-4-amino-4,6-dideoxygalactose transaminase
MIPRGAPYISWTDILAGFLYCLIPGHRDRVRQRLLDAFVQPGQTGAACLSVRSGLDALFEALALPPGSEIIVSAITIPHILEILARHDLRAIPVDVDPDTLAVDAIAVRDAITPLTKAVLVAHLFGSRMPLDEIRAVASAANLLLLEDCAQANDGSGFRGHPASDVRMFSFGIIKRQTAAGGGIFTLNDRALAESVRTVLAGHPIQKRAAYARRLLLMAAIKAATSPSIFTLFVACCRLAGRDYDAVFSSALRAFSAGNLFRRLRQQPCTPLLKLMARQIRRQQNEEVARRHATVAGVLKVNPDLPRPGSCAAGHSHWLFAVTVDDSAKLHRSLVRAGFDATRGASNLVSVPAPGGTPAPANAERMMQEVLYLTLHPAATPRDIHRLALAIRDHIDASAAEPEPALT